jgi:hypothetical protein
LRRIAEKVVGNAVAVDILPAPTRGAMSKDDTKVEDGVSDDTESDEPLTDDAIDDDLVGDDVLVVEDDVVDDDVLPVEDDDGVADDAKVVETDADSDTEALDDLEAEELEMLTEDEAKETIVVDEETQLRDIRRAQISIEASSVGGPDQNEFVCSVCFLVKKSSQLSSRRKKMCLDCAG